MDNVQSEQQIRELTEKNEQMKAALEEIRRAIDPFLEKKPASQTRTFEQQLIHDVRNILNELGLLRALVPTDDEA